MFYTVLLLAAVAAIGGCTKCYMCSTAQTSCTDPFKEDGDVMMQDCTPAIVSKFESEMHKSILKTLTSLGSTLFNTDISKEITRHTEFSCLKLDFGDGERKESLRGCVPRSQTTGDQHWCKIMEDRLNRDKVNRVSFCGYCDSDGCNSAPHGVAPTSLLALLLMAAGAFLLSR